MRIFTDPRCLRHRPPDGFPERPQRLRAILDHLGAAGRVVEGPDERPSAAAVAARAAVTAVHPESYVERFERAVERGDSLLDSADNPLGPETAEAAWGAVTAVLAAADAATAGGGA